MVIIYKCPNCGFECASQKLLEQHIAREEQDLTEYQEKKLIQKEQIKKREEYLLSKENE